MRSVKVSLQATLKEQYPSDETFQTLLCEAEHTVNSRPLTHVSIDGDDPEALTPNHFLILSSSTRQPMGTFTDSDLCLRRNWRIAQLLADKFWKRWLKEYLPTLATRSKWSSGSPKFQPGDMVIITDDNAPRNQWLKGIVTATHPGKDGIVRVADIKTILGTYRRPVVKLIPLNVNKIL